jgi:glutamyl-tRNA reductase
MRYTENSIFGSSKGTPFIGEKILSSTAIPGTLFAFGLNYKTAPVEIREKLHLNEAEIQLLLERVKGRLSECLVISTCNRTEIYGVSETADIDLSFFKDLLVDIKDARGFLEDEHFFALISCAACQQLFNVATSIDSRVIGDSQILRQLRGAYSIAQERGYTGKILNQLLQRAFKLGKTTYNETSIHDGAVSVSLAAVELAIETFGSLQGRTALVIGAGETARLTAEALVNKHVGKIIVTNRTRSHAEDLLSSLHQDFAFESEVLDFENFKDQLGAVDIVISSTGSNEPILYKEDFEGQTSKKLLIDIAVPRDIDISVTENDNVILNNIDDLHSIIDGNQERRMMDLPKVKRMIVKEMVEFLSWYYLLPIMPNYEKTGVKPSREQTAEILRIKEFLTLHVPEIHKLAAQAGEDFQQDLESHFSLIHKLQTMKARTLGVVAV